MGNNVYSLYTNKVITIYMLMLVLFIYKSVKKWSYILSLQINIQYENVF